MEDQAAFGKNSFKAFYLNIASVPFFSKYNPGFNEGFPHGTSFCEGPACIVEVLALGLLG